MPLVVFKHQPSALSHSKIAKFGGLARKVIATYCSVKRVPLTEDDIDFEPMERHPAAIASTIAIEIETYQFPSRVKKLTRRKTLQLKTELAALMKLCEIDVPKGAWLWVKYVSPKGHHV